MIGGSSENQHESRGNITMESEAPGSPSNPDLLSVNLDRLTPSNLKSTEEIRRHSIDSTLEEKPIEKALYFFTVGEEVQKLSVVKSLADLYRQDPAGCSQKLVPKMQQCLPIASSEFHLATSVTIKSLMERKIIPLDTFVQTFLHTILTGTEHRDPMVADAWVDCLVDIIPNIPFAVLQRDVHPLAVTKAAHQKPVSSRISSCRIIGALCKKYSSVDAKRDLMPLVLSLCQDVDPAVRAAVTLQIPCIVRLLGSETSKNMLLPALVDLASDESSRVKEAAFTALVDSIPFFSSDVIKTVVLPLLVQLMNYAFKYDINVLLAIAASFGKMVIGLERVMQSSDKDMYLKSYASILGKCSYKNTEYAEKTTLLKQGQSPGQGMSSGPHLIGTNAVKCRQYCAYNYPAMAKFAFSENNKAPLEALHAIFQELLSDPSPLVRSSMTVSLHEVITIYGKYKSLLKPEICKALENRFDEVLAGFVPHLGFILVNFIHLCNTQNEQSGHDTNIVEALTDCENYLGKTSNWRLHAKFIEQLEVLWYLFPPETVYNRFIFNFFKKLYIHRALPVRMAFVRTILVNVKYTPKEAYRSEAMNKINELAVSDSFYDRMLYIRTCNVALELFSTYFFKEHFFYRLLRMAGDAVANIRWAWCKLLPKMYNMLKLPADKELLSELDVLTHVLSEDKDKEVVSMMQNVRIELDETANINIFPLDQKKYDEEKAVFSLNQKLVLNFPTSCLKMFEPTVGGTPIMRRSSITVLEYNDDKESIATQVDSPSLIPGDSESGASGSSSRSDRNLGNRGQLSSESQAGFTAQEFLVDAGVTLPLNKFEKSSSINNNCSNGTEKVKFCGAKDCNSISQDNDKDNNKANQNELKTSPKKKPILRHSIPVRKKNIPSEQNLIRNGEDTKTSTSKFVDFAKRHSLEIRNHLKIENQGVLQIDKRRSVEVSNTEKRHSLEVVDINKNLTEKPSDTDVSNNTIQRRKKSQLPRPLSCVVLPVRNKGLDKTNTTSKLPVMRRT